jgi:uncharacterized membrane protein
MWSLWGEFNEGELLLLGQWGAGWMALLGAGAVAVLTLSYLDLREMKPRRRAWTLWWLRALVLAVGFLMLLEPALELRAVSKMKNHVAVVLDRSTSMEVGAGGGRTRLQAAAAALTQAQPLMMGANDSHLFEFFHFGERLERSSWGALQDPSAQPAPGAEATLIREALDNLKSLYPRNTLGGVVILSDGADSGVLAGRNPRGAKLDAETADFIRRLGVPIYTLGVASADGLRDVAVEEVLHDSFAFVHNRMAMDISVRGLGVGAEAAVVELWKDGERVRAQQVKFSGDDDTQRVTFELVPEQMGKSVMTVRVSSLRGEATLRNNSYHFVVKVIRDKIRVLQVCGRPSVDERFLRQLLKENPNVDLISFFILRTGSDLQLVANNELSLIPFPKDELFDEQLPSFDLVFFQNFNFAPYMPAHYLDRLEEFVRGGGALAMLGGELSFSHGGYERTPLAEVLPIQLRSLAEGKALLDEAYFSPQLTEAGLRHPMTRMAFDPALNAKLWGELPALEGTNIVGGLAEGATALATHPIHRTPDGDPMPVIAVREVDKGRTMSFTTDSAWFWSLAYAGSGGTARPYNNFWNNAIRWLIQDPELKLIKVENEREELAPGQPLRSRVRVLTPSYLPAAHVKGTLRLRRRFEHQLDPSIPPTADDPSDPNAASSPPLLEVPFETDGSGQFIFEHTLNDLGAYSLQAEAEQAGAKLSDEDLVLVTYTSPELRDILPRNDLLRAVAAASDGGQFIPVPSADADALIDALRFTPPRVIRVERRRLISLWDGWWAFGLLTLLLAAEWLLRRRWGRL